jgi:integrase
LTRRHFGNVRKLPSDRYQASYWHEGARHVAPDTFPTKADALAWLSSAETDIHRGGWVDPAAGKLTVEQLSKLWLASNARKRSSTLARDEAIVRLHVLPQIGARRLSSVTPADIQCVVNAWALEQAPSTVGRQYTALAAMFAYAVDSDRIVRTPCRRIRLPQVRQVERPELSADDLERLAEALGADQSVMMWTGAALGLRFAECAGLTVDRLDLLAGNVTVDRQLGRDGTLSEPKSAAGKRTMACPAWLVDDLAALLARRGLTAADADAFVFVSPTGAPLHYTNWRRRVWLRACKAAGLPELVFHDLRSLSATALVDVGANLKVTQRRLGHSSPKVTLDLYAKATTRADREAAEKVGAYLRPSRRATGPKGGGAPG